MEPVKEPMTEEEEAAAWEHYEWTCQWIGGHTYSFVKFCRENGYGEPSFRDE